MKKIFFIALVFLFFDSYCQKNVHQLREKLHNLPQNSSIEVISKTDRQNLIIDTVQKDFFVPQVNYNQLKIIKYNDTIQKVTGEEEKKYRDKLSLTLPGDRIKKIPEFHMEIPEDSGVGGDPLIFSPMFTNLKPLVYDPDNEEGFTSVLSFMLFSENGENKQKIKTPVHLEINSTRLNTVPQRITMDYVNLPSKDIKVFTREVKDSVDIKIITSSAPKGYVYYLKVDPFLRLSSHDNDIQGLGIEEAEFDVQFRGSSSSDEELVTIRSSAGEVNPSSFNLAYNKTQKVKVRSQGLKDIVLTASVATTGSTPIPDSNTLVFEQKFPFLFLGFAIIGGILGVLIRLGVEGARKYPARMMMSGILMGLLGSLAYYVLGINLLELEVSSTFNEFAVLTFSALCSLMLQPVFFKEKNIPEIEA